MTDLLTKSSTAAVPRSTEGLSNPFKIPRGEKLRREIVAVFREQRKAIDQFLKTGQKDQQPPPPFEFPPLHEFGLGALDIADRFTPMLTLTWEAAAAKFAPRVGLDPDAWSVTNPYTERIIAEQALAFSDSMNQTTSLQLDDALNRVREALRQGTVERGETLPQITKRIAAIFDDAETWRARRIAWTETSRAVHAAQERAAVASGVVTGWQWLASGDACPMCVAIAARCKFMRIGQPFAVIGNNAHYSEIRFPPAHPHCSCTCIEVLDTDVQPEFGTTLEQPEPATDEELARVGAEIAARDEAILKPKPISSAPVPRPKPVPPKPRPKPKPVPQPAVQPVMPSAPKPGEAILPGRPIAERLAAWTEGDRLVAEMAKLRPATMQELNAAIGKLEDFVERLSPKDRKKPANVAREAELRAAAQAVSRQRFNFATLGREQLLKLMAPGESPDWHTTIPSGVDPKVRARIEEGEKFVRGLLARGTARGVDFEYDIHSGDYRAHAGGTRVNLSDRDGPRTVAHEIGHVLEDQIKGIAAVEKEFLAHRAGNESPKRFRDLFPTGKYDAHERGVEDEFGKFFSKAGSDGEFDDKAARYVGKHYPNRSELLSMGIEALYVDAPRFARQDPEYFKLVVGLLNGALR